MEVGGARAGRRSNNPMPACDDVMHPPADDLHADNVTLMHAEYTDMTGILQDDHAVHEVACACKMMMMPSQSHTAAADSPNGGAAAYVADVHDPAIIRYEIKTGQHHAIGKDGSTSCSCCTEPRAM